MEESYLMAYDTTTGDILGFYLKSIHGDNIPTPNKEVTKEKHNFYMENNGKYKINVTTLEDELIPVTTNTQQPTQDEILRAKLLKDNADIKLQLVQQQQINANLLNQVAKLTGGTK